MAVVMQSVLRGTLGGPDPYKTDAKEWSALGISSFLSWLLFFRGYCLFIFFLWGKSNPFEQRNFPNLLLSEILCGSQSIKMC